MAVLSKKIPHDEWKKDNFPHSQRADLHARRQVFWDSISSAMLMSHTGHYGSIFPLGLGGSS